MLSVFYAQSQVYIRLNMQYYEVLPMYDDELNAKRFESPELCYELNLLSAEDSARYGILKKLLSSLGDDPWIISPFKCDFGKNISVGNGVRINYSFLAVGSGAITIGDNVFIGPNALFDTTVCPDAPAKRLPARFAPITVGDNVWLAADVTVVGGVTIGDGAVVGMGSVVTEDVPPYVFAAGNPARVIRPLDDDMKNGR